MTENQKARKKLQDELRKLFQFDVSDLDFGIYRILNRKKGQIEQFIEKDLLDALNDGLQEYQQQDASQIEEFKQQILDTIGPDAFNEEGELVDLYRNSPLGKKYLDALEKAEKQQVGADTEKKIYNDLFTFFSRYYSEGDFVTKRRISTRDSKYAVPYNGEEVLLHWANKDQYYIKTGEHFTNYKFEVDGKSVWFKVAQAEQDRDNVKEEEKRSFVLRPDNPIEVNDDELTIWFEYRPLTDVEEDQWLKVYNSVEKSRKTIDRQALCIAYDEWIRSEIDGEWRKLLSVIPQNKDRSILYQKLNHYTGKNTTDYFIHKDLQSFLERELEYYLKNEVIRVDDFIEDQTEQAMDIALTRARVVRGIANKIITFISQIENFQKKLFEKRKFVVDTHYCFTLDRVPEALYETILQNEQQLKVWEELYAMEKWDSELKWDGNWTKKFLKDHPFLMIDTKWFDEEFKYQLLSNAEDIDQLLDGLMINGENFQSLNIISKKYSSKVKSVYIDPPYNTNASEIIYKNNYKHSSWLSFLENRLELTKSLMSDNGVLCVTIDHVELHRLRSLVGKLFGEENLLGLITIKNNPSGRSTVKGVSIANEFAIIVGASESAGAGNLPRTKEQLEQYPEKDEQGRYQWRYFLRSGGANDFRSARPRLHYPLFVKGNDVRIPDMSWDGRKKEWTLEEDPKNNETVFYPTSNGEEYTWRLGVESLEKRIDELRARESRNGSIILEIKFRLDENGVLPKTIWDNKYYNATSYGTSLLRNIIGESQSFSFPKSVYAVEDSLRVTNLDKNDITIDFFAGSGTTGHAVLNLNKEDEGNRKFILVEMGQYFDTVLKPRIQKVVFH
jgi:adenine-specific DNA-methyltransferase